MSFSLLGDLNWLAVLVAGIARMALGAVWHAPGSLGKPLFRALDWGVPKIGSPAFFFPVLVGHLIVAIAVGMLAVATGTDTFAEGIVLGLVAGVGVAAASVFDPYYFNPKAPKKTQAFAIDGTYHALATMVAAVIVAVWR